MRLDRCELRSLLADAARDLPRVHHGAEGQRRTLDAVLTNGHQVVTMEEPRFRYGAVLMPTDRGEGEVLDTVLGVVAHLMDVPAEDALHIACLDEPAMDLVPVIPILSADPARVVAKDEDVGRVLGDLQCAVQPSELLGAHTLAVGVVEVALAQVGVGLVCVEDDEPCALVPERVPQRTEVHLVTRLVLFRRYGLGSVA